MTGNSDRWGHLSSEQDEASQRQYAIEHPGNYHGDIAASELHWYDGDGWVNRDPAGGWKRLVGAAAAPGDDWRPWQQSFDDSDAPYYRWFVGAHTNACFNEVDRHVLAERGTHTAIIFEGDRWDPSRNDGKGGPVHEEHVSYRPCCVKR